MLRPSGVKYWEIIADNLSKPRMGGYVHANIKTMLLRLWARISRKLTGKPQQLELNLWNRPQDIEGGA